MPDPVSVSFKYCTQSVFDNLQTNSSLVTGGLYFITDSGRLYRATAPNASIVYSQPFLIVNDFPVSNQLQNCLYIHATTHEIRSWNGTQYIVVVPAQTNLYRYKGSCTYANLPSSGQETGDVWNVTDEHDGVPAGTNYAWNGTGWDALGGSVDLSTYLTVSAASSTYLSKADAQTTYATKAVATTSADGLMSAADKTKLDGLGNLTWTEVTNS